MPFVAWYITLDNHNQIHYWQTYRSVAVAFGAVAAFMAVAVASGAGTSRVTAEDARYAVPNGDDEAITSEPPEEQDPTPQVLSPQ